MKYLFLPIALCFAFIVAHKTQAQTVQTQVLQLNTGQTSFQRSLERLGDTMKETIRNQHALRIQMEDYAYGYAREKLYYDEEKSNIYSKYFGKSFTYQNDFDYAFSHAYAEAATSAYYHAKNKLGYAHGSAKIYGDKYGRSKIKIGNSDSFSHSYAKFYTKTKKAGYDDDFSNQYAFLRARGYSVYYAEAYAETFLKKYSKLTKKISIFLSSKKQSSIRAKATEKAEKAARKKAEKADVRARFQAIMDSSY